MDSKDYQIIAALQANGRMTNQELSEQVSLTPTPCLRRLRMLEESGMIRGYTAVVDEEAFGLPVTAFVGVKLKEHTADAVRKFERAIQAVDAVLDCYVMTGQVDYLLRVLTQSLKDYERFVRQELHAIPGIQSIDTSVECPVPWYCTHRRINDLRPVGSNNLELRVQLSWNYGKRSSSKLELCSPPNSIPRALHSSDQQYCIKR